jgi:arsenical pump membrane protein
VLAALGRGTEVYLFLIGMMALSAYARRHHIFDWVAAYVLRIAGPSRLRLFALIYLAGIGTTALLSNDATIVALTPAVIHVLRRCNAPPVPYLTACALVANAASFVLPISNPSNLLVFAGRMPSLETWLAAFGLPALAGLGVTFVLAWWYFRRELAGNAADVDVRAARTPAPYTVVLLALATGGMVFTSARAGPLGEVTFACGALACIATAVRDPGGAVFIIRAISWRVIALTALLFVIVTGVDNAGGFAATRDVFAWCAGLAAPWSTLAIGFIVAFAAGAINNLPVGLNLGETLPAMHAGLHVAKAALIGVNLGPNATAHGSIATLLWLSILRREGIALSPLAFIRVGLFTVIPSLAAALLLV